MEFILIGILFIIQLLSIFWIAMLNTKLNKYKDLERKQQKVIEEMDNSIGAYLLEMKEENDRLLREIQATSKKQQMQPDVLQTQVDSLENVQPEAHSVSFKTEKAVAHIPKTIATNAYEKQIEKGQVSFEQNKVSAILNQNETKPLTFEQKVMQMFEEGQTIEQIAKNTNKGKTEIELLLKFSS